MRVTPFDSRGRSSSQKRYPAHKLKFQALKWLIVRKFQDYLYGNTFTVVTDNNTLTYVLKSAKLGAASYRWLAVLSTFNFHIKYRAGKSNQDADGLSRRPHDSETDDRASLEEKRAYQTVRFTQSFIISWSTRLTTALCQPHFMSEPDNNLPSITLVESLAIHPDAVLDIFMNEEVFSRLPYLPTVKRNFNSVKGLTRSLVGLSNF